MQKTYTLNPIEIIGYYCDALPAYPEAVINPQSCSRLEGDGVRKLPPALLLDNKGKKLLGLLKTYLHSNGALLAQVSQPYMTSSEDERVWQGK